MSTNKRAKSAAKKQTSAPTAQQVGIVPELLAEYAGKVSLWTVTDNRYVEIYHVTSPRDIYWQTLDPEAAYSRFVYEVLCEFVGTDLDPLNLFVDTEPLGDRFAFVEGPEEEATNAGVKLIAELRALVANYRQSMGAEGAVEN